MTTDGKTEQQTRRGCAGSSNPATGVEIDKTADEADEAQQDDDATAATRPRGSAARSRATDTSSSPPSFSSCFAGRRCADGVAVLQPVPARRADRRHGRSAAVDAARDGTVAMLSYKPDTLDQDFAAAKSHLTGDFLNYYDHVHSSRS